MTWAVREPATMDAMPKAETSRDLARRDVRTAALILVVGLLAIAVGITGNVAVGVTSSPWWHVIPLVVGCVAITVQQRWPVPALTVGVACLLIEGVRTWSLGTILVAWEVLYTAALRYPWPRVHLLRRAAIGLAAVVTIAAGIVAKDVRTVANVGLFAFTVLGTPLWWGIDVRRQADIARLVEENAGHDRDRAVQAERARMARDLHDAVAGDLASIAIHAEAGLRHTPPDHPAHEPLSTIRRSGVRAMGELSTMISLLRRDAGDEVVSPPGLDALDDLVAHAEASGLRVSVERSTPDQLPVAVDQAAYRILQEAFTNAARHGGPGEARVRLAATDALEIEMVSTSDDPARPTAGTPGTGLGLVTMRERAEGLGGRFESGWDDARWRVAARIPLAA
jgi:signal transduction histidine kinase